MSCNYLRSFTLLLVSSVCAGGEPASELETRGESLIRAEAVAQEIMYNYCIELFPRLEKDLKPAMIGSRAAFAQAAERLKPRISRSPTMSRLERIEQATAQDVENVKELVRQNGTESFCNAYALVLKQNTTDAIYARYLARFDSTDEMTKNFKIEIR